MAPGKDELRKYWEKKGLEKGSQATMRDFHLRELEVAALRGELKRDDVVLDVGAGNGASGIQLAPRVKRIVLSDFAHRMVQEARESITRSGATNAEAEVADVLDLSRFADRGLSAVFRRDVLLIYRLSINSVLQSTRFVTCW